MRRVLMILLQFIKTQQNIYQALLMFLYSLSRKDDGPCLSPERSLSKHYKITQLLNMKPMTEIRQHRRKNFYINSRTYLIENTKKIIRERNHSGEYTTFSPMSKEAIAKNPFNLTNRETRQAAARTFRQKIWRKSNNNLTTETDGRKRMRYTTVAHTKSQLFDNSQQKIPMYRDSVLHKLHIKTMDDIGGFSKNTGFSTKTNSFNPERLQVKNIGFSEQKEDKLSMNRSNLFTNRTVKKNSKILHHYNFMKYSKRPSTTTTHNRDKMTESQSFLEPW